MNKLRNENKINKATPEKSSSPSTWSAPGKGNCDGCPPAGKENRCIWAPKTVGGTTRRHRNPGFLDPWNYQASGASEKTGHHTPRAQPPEQDDAAAGTWGCLQGGDEQQIGEGVGRKQLGTHLVRGKLHGKAWEGKRRARQQPDGERCGLSRNRERRGRDEERSDLESQMERLLETLFS
jgi:hypothetical protein